MTGSTPRVGFGTVLRHSPFAWLTAAQAQSLIGDQVARVALALLVYDRMHSTLLTAAVYGLTFLPAVVGGTLLGGLGDRFAPRSVLVSADSARAVCFAAMAVPGEPLWTIVVLLVVGVTVGGVFQATAPAYVAHLFDGEARSAAMGVRSSVVQLGTLAGFAVGGVAVGGVGARGGLLLDAASFAVSVAALAWGLRHHPGPQRTRGAEVRRTPLRARVAQTMATPRRRQLVALSWLVGFWVVPESLAAPYARSHGGGDVAAGLLLAAVPAGCVVGTYVLMQQVAPARRPAAARVLAVLTGVPLLFTALNPPLPVLMAVWAVAGVCAGYPAQTITEYSHEVPAEVRAQSMGVMTSGLLTVQGLGALVAGAIGSGVGPGAAVAVMAAVGSLGALLCVTAGDRGGSVDLLPGGGTRVRHRLAPSRK